LLPRSITRDYQAMHVQGACRSVAPDLRIRVHQPHSRDNAGRSQHEPLVCRHLALNRRERYFTGAPTLHAAALDPTRSIVTQGEDRY